MVWAFVFSIHNPNRILPARNDYVTFARTGQIANISDCSGTDLYITYKTATSNSLSHNTLVVGDIQVINESKVSQFEFFVKWFDNE